MLQNIDYDKYATTQAIAEKFHCSYQNIHYHIMRGNIKDVIKLGESHSKPIVLVNKKEAEEVLNRQKLHHRISRGRKVVKHDGNGTN